MADKKMKHMDSLVSDIPDFYKGKSIFITGGAGFMGKVLVERILATCPDVGNIYLLMREKKDVTPEKRLQQLKESKVFEILRAKNPSQLDKIVAISGDITKPDFGFSADDREKLNEVSIIFHGAASLSMNAPLNESVDSNLRPTMALLALSDTLPNLDVFIHVSTLYCNADIAISEEKAYPPPMELKMILDLADNPNLDKEQQKKIVESKLSTYAFTKSLAENAVTEHGCANFSVGVVRPGIVICSLRYPFPGWMENLNGISGVIAYVSSGFLKVFDLNGPANAHIVPVDITIDTFIAAAWELAVDRPAQVRFYNCTCQENPITWDSFMKAVDELCVKYPSVHAVSYPQFHGHHNKYLLRINGFLLETIPIYFMENIFSLVNKKYKPRLINQLIKVQKMREAVSPFSATEFNFKNENVQRLRRRLSEKDRAVFNLDPFTIDWNEMMLSMVRGTRRHVMMEPDSTLVEARARVRKMGYAIKAAKGAVMVAGLTGAYLLYRQFGHVPQGTCLGDPRQTPFVAAEKPSIKI